MNNNGYNRNNRNAPLNNNRVNNDRRYAPGRRRNTPRFPWTALIMGILFITAFFAVIWAIALNGEGPSDTQPQTTGEIQTTENQNVTSAPTDTEESTSGSETPVFDPEAYTEMTLLATGDVMYHNPQLDAAYDYATGEYDFTNCYKYIKSIVSAADYAVANFETTLAGTDTGYSYAGYPVFNTPDSGLSALVDAGFDMMLFANNHCYDTQHTGVIRTQEVFDSMGVDYIGARKDSSGKTYRTVEVNGITLGMLNSTDDIAYGNTSPRTINGITIQSDDLPLLDIINHSLLEDFYAEAQARISELRSSGADIIIYFIHWGNEYYLYHNDIQGQIAQRLCDMGVDVIIGSHPHVIQDAEILTSSQDPTHSTLCFYSMGNLISNQNRLTMGDTMNSTYTENGLIVELTVRKYATGETIVTAVRTVPLWVHRYYDSAAAKMRYEIVPVDAAVADPASYGLYNSDFGVSHASAVSAMTNGILGGICEAFAASVQLPTGAN